MLTGPTLPPAGGAKPNRIVVLLHGLGADGNDLIGLAPVLAKALPGTLFVAPDAPQPCDTAPYGRQWFSLQDRRPTSLYSGATTADPLLRDYIDELLARHALSPAKLALVGFSQGTMMALHHALRREEPVGAVVGFSGLLVGADKLAAEIRSKPPVLLVHGDRDDVVPVEALFAAVEALQAVEVPLIWEVRKNVPHSIDPGGLDAGISFLQRALA